jgi:hypothetical protein
MIDVEEQAATAYIKVTQSNARTIAASCRGNIGIAKAADRGFIEDTGKWNYANLSPAQLKKLGAVANRIAKAACTEPDRREKSWSEETQERLLQADEQPKPAVEIVERKATTNPIQEKRVLLGLLLETSVSESDKRILGALFRIIYSTSERYAVKLTDLAAEAHVHLATVNRRVPKLEAAGWYERGSDRGGWSKPTVFIGLWAKAFERYANLASHRSATRDDQLASHNSATQDANLASHSCATPSSILDALPLEPLPQERHDSADRSVVRGYAAPTGFAEDGEAHDSVTAIRGSSNVHHEAEQNGGANPPREAITPSKPRQRPRVYLEADQDRGAIPPTEEELTRPNNARVPRPSRVVLEAAQDGVATTPQPRKARVMLPADDHDMPPRPSSQEDIPESIPDIEPKLNHPADEPIRARKYQARPMTPEFQAWLDSRPRRARDQCV